MVEAFKSSREPCSILLRCGVGYCLRANIMVDCMVDFACGWSKYYGDCMVDFVNNFQGVVVECQSWNKLSTCHDMSHSVSCRVMSHSASE